MADRQVYECENCGKTLESQADESKEPECCDKPMQKVVPLDACNTSATAEHSRFDTLDDACDDGRSGNV